MMARRWKVTNSVGKLPSPPAHSVRTVARSLFGLTETKDRLCGWPNRSLGFRHASCSFPFYRVLLRCSRCRHSLVPVFSLVLRLLQVACVYRHSHHCAVDHCGLFRLALVLAATLWEMRKWRTQKRLMTRKFAKCKTSWLHQQHHCHHHHHPLHSAPVLFPLTHHHHYHHQQLRPLQPPPHSQKQLIWLLHRYCEILEGLDDTPHMPLDQRIPCNAVPPFSTRYNRLRCMLALGIRGCVSTLV